jgi:hypothetical protein
MATKNVVKMELFHMDNEMVILLSSIDNKNLYLFVKLQENTASNK